jgi:hypothetical protein
MKQFQDLWFQEVSIKHGMNRIGPQRKRRSPLAQRLKKLNLLKSESLASGNQLIEEREHSLRRMRLEMEAMEKSPTHQEVKLRQLLDEVRSLLRLAPANQGKANETIRSTDGRFPLQSGDLSRLAKENATTTYHALCQRRVKALPTGAPTNIRSRLPATKSKRP